MKEVQLVRKSKIWYRCQFYSEWVSR